MIGIYVAQELWKPAIRMRKKAQIAAAHAKRDGSSTSAETIERLLQALDRNWHLRSHFAHQAFRAQASSRRLVGETSRPRQPSEPAGNGASGSDTKANDTI